MHAMLICYNFNNTLSGLSNVKRIIQSPAMLLENIMVNFCTALCDPLH